MAQTRLVEIILKAKDEASGAFKSLDESMGGVDKKQIALAVSAAAAAAAIGVAVKKTLDFVDGMSRLGDEMFDISERTGIAVETLSELEYALKLNGGSIGDLEVGVKKLSRSMFDAMEGTEASVDAFARLGISTAELTNSDGSIKTLAQMLPMIADGMKRVQSQAERIDIAQELFGRGGISLVPLLQQGSEGLAAMRQEIEALGGAMSGSFAAGSDKMQDSLVGLTTAWQRFKEALAEPLLIPATKAIEELTKVIGGLNGGNKRAMLAAYAATQPEPTGVMAGYDAYLAGRGSGPASGVLQFNMTAEAASRMGDAVAAAIQGPDAQAPSGPRDMSVMGEYVGDLFFETSEEAERFRDAIAEATEMVADPAWSDLEDTSRAISESMQYAAMSIQDSLDGALYNVLATGQNVAQALAQAFQRAFADIAASFLSAGIMSLIGLPVGGPFAAMLGGGKAAGVAGTKSAGMIDHGEYFAKAGMAYGKGFI